MTFIADEKARTTAFKALKGKAKYSNMCQAFVRLTSGLPGLGDIDGDRDADAVDGWKDAEKRGKVVYASAIKNYDSIPSGVWLYWSGGSHGYGHAAYSIGKGRMMSTDAPTYKKIGEVDIEWVAAHWRMRFLGYVVDDGRGHVLYKKPTVPAKPTTSGVDMKANVGFGNLYMGYSYYNSKVSASEKLKLWTPEKEQRSAEFMMGMGCSMYGIVEAHEENQMVDRWFKHWQDQKPQFELFKGSDVPDGNGFIADMGKLKLLRNPVTTALPHSRAMTRYNFEHLASNVPFWVFVYHLIAGQATKRDTQMKMVVTESRFASRSLHLADLNGYGLTGTNPVKQAMDAGMTDAYAHAKKLGTVKNDMPSHDGGTLGKNLDHILTGPLAEAEELQFFDPGDLADHKWLKALVNIEAYAA